VARVVVVQDRVRTGDALFRSLMRASSPPHRGGQFIGRVSMTGRRCCHTGKARRFFDEHAVGPDEDRRGRVAAVRAR